jgi:TonB family protein
MEKAIVISLGLVVILLLFFPTMKLAKKKEYAPGFSTTIVAEDIPITRQGTYRKQTIQPAIPIPSQDQKLSEDTTIEKTEINYEIPGSSDGSSQGGAASLPRPEPVFQPRPIYEVIPEYSEELQKKGIQGLVKLHIHITETGVVDEVIILENTTDSDKCAESARQAALKSRYIPAKRGSAPTDFWINRTYTFGIQK